MIVLTAPTGQIGRPLLDRLVDLDAEVRVIVRDPEKLPSATRERVGVVVGSHDDPAVLNAALAGADNLFWLVPPNPSVEDVVGYYQQFTRPAAEAVQRHDVARVVAVSSLGRAYPGYAGNLSAAFASDELFEDAGVDFRALRMPYFMENLLALAPSIAQQRTLLTAQDVDRPLATVAVADIASTAADVLLDDTWRGQGNIPVVGPDNLSPNQMAEVISGVLDQRIRCRQLPLDEYRASLVSHGLSDGWARGLIDMITAQNDGIYDAESRAADRRPTSFREWCTTTLAPAVRLS